MARKLGTSLFYVRLLQLLVWVAILLGNGWLSEYIIQSRLGFANSLAAVDFIAGFATVYTVLPIFLLHSRHKTLRKRYLIIFVVCDILFMGTVVAMMTILSVAGLPDNCQRLTRENYNSGDAPNNPKPGFTTIRFGSGPGNRGELDKYCVVPRVSWGLCIFLIYTYTTTLILAVLRIHTIIHPSNDPESKATLASKPSSISLATLSPLTAVQTPRHELPTMNNTAELASPVSELSSPIAPHPGYSVNANAIGADQIAEVEPCISNGSRGTGTPRPARSASIRSDPPPYMPASERILNRAFSFGPDRKG